MIVLDTNVVSELMNPRGSPTVKSWANSQPRENLVTTTITQAEILYGIALLPEGRRKQKLQNAARATFDQDFLNKILLFDLDSAEYFAHIAANRRSQGLPISQFDAQIAAICRAHGATIATRNVDDFINCRLEIINPWE
ncbi:MAG: type II toxin-antitoxin system VapC family toxin [Phormidium sp. GEM2.Bin31]|nr:type II toxin-antitoxin system VapC family toxin [Phormidium sp. BM_Day4_Bin.17]TVR14603.1 MAG: type II toxin-antitoxin system VapC family toxin [Phormidium sp. GEM2.Bin31]UCJ11572.1 MAG: type II toxin-antitoxin system VapC family toxin [Phormidium sp. PBR-2020]